MRALGERGVEAVATPEAWASRGTVAFLGSGTSLYGAFVGLRRGSPLRAFVAEPTEGHEVVVFTGAVASVREALTREAPARYTGVVAEVAELRVSLATALVARRAARLDLATPKKTLLEREHAASSLTGQIVHVLDRAHELASAPAVHAGVSAELTRARVELQSARTATDELARRKKQAEDSPQGTGASALWDEWKNSDDARVACEQTVTRLEGEEQRAVADEARTTHLEAGGRLGSTAEGE